MRIAPPSVLPISLVFFTILVSCQTMFMRSMGINDPKELSEEKIKEEARRQNVPLENLFVLDTSFLPYMMTRDTGILGEAVKNHYQPLQAMYFDKTGKLKSFHVNCYAYGGNPTKLDWSPNGEFSTFPPKLNPPLDSLFEFKDLKPFLHPTSSTLDFSADTMEHVVIVFWNRFMGRHSTELIRVVQENRKLYSGQRISILFVSNDNAYAYNWN